METKINSITYATDCLACIYDPNIWQKMTDDERNNLTIIFQKIMSQICEKNDIKPYDNIMILIDKFVFVHGFRYNDLDKAKEKFIRISNMLERFY